ncbi:MAG: hypothetical protein AAB367_03550 [Patescibacteria group bacterium]
MFKKFVAYYKNNPGGYWFKRNPFGWGWIPVKWQGWIVTLSSVALISGGIYIGETDDAPGAALLGIVLAALLTFGFGHKKGEKVCWQWGFPKDKA